jgi:hypothetical protein
VIDASSSVPSDHHIRELLHCDKLFAVHHVFVELAKNCKVQKYGIVGAQLIEYIPYALLYIFVLLSAYMYE